MKRFLPMIGFILLFFPISLQARELRPRPINIDSYSKRNKKTPRGKVYQNIRPASLTDTTVLAYFDFEAGLNCDPQGWYGVDLTAQIDTFFHVDDYNPVNGAHSLWCGTGPDSTSPYLCSYSALPGYGNRWNQIFESTWFSFSSGDPHLFFQARYDCEQMTDIVYIQYKEDTASNWTDLTTLTGSVR